MKCCTRRLVGELDAVAAVGRAAGLRAARAPRGSRLAASPRVDGRTRPGAAGVDDDGDAVVPAEVFSTSSAGHALTSGSLFGRLHRARDVDQEHEVTRRHAVLVDRLRLEADPHQAVLGIPRARGDFALTANGSSPAGSGSRRGSS